MKEILNRLLLRSMAVDKVFGRSAEDNLTGHADRRIFLETDWRLLLVSIVEDDGNARLGNAGLAAFIDEVLQNIALATLCR